MEDPVVTWHTWYGLGEAMVAAFAWRYMAYMSEFDGFVVTHSPVFCRLFEGFGKPVFLVNSCRYDQPYCYNGDEAERQALHTCLHNLLVPVDSHSTQHPSVTL